MAAAEVDHSDPVRNGVQMGTVFAYLQYIDRIATSSQCRNQVLHGAVDAAMAGRRDKDRDARRGKDCHKSIGYRCGDDIGRKRFQLPAAKDSMAETAGTTRLALARPRPHDAT